MRDSLLHARFDLPQDSARRRVSCWLSLVRRVVRSVHPTSREVELPGGDGVQEPPRWLPRRPSSLRAGRRAGALAMDCEQRVAFVEALSCASEPLRDKDAPYGLGSAWARAVNVRAALLHPPATLEAARAQPLIRLPVFSLRLVLAHCVAMVGCDAQVEPLLLWDGPVGNPFGDGSDFCKALLAVEPLQERPVASPG